MKRPKTLSDALERACNDARNLKPQREVMRAGVLFAIPCIPTGKWKQLFNSTGPMQLFQDIDADLRWFWYDKENPVRKSEYHYAGVEVLVKLIK